MSDFNTAEFTADRSRVDRGQRIIDSLGTWLVVGNAGALVLLYNAGINGRIRLDGPAYAVAGLLVCGTILAFLSRFFVAVELLNKRRERHTWLTFVMSGIALICAMASPMVFHFTTCAALPPH